jgi:hypothetical protein
VPYKYKKQIDINDIASPIAAHLHYRLWLRMKNLIMTVGMTVSFIPCKS